MKEWKKVLCSGRSGVFFYNSCFITGMRVCPIWPVIHFSMTNWLRRWALLATFILVLLCACSVCILCSFHTVRLWLHTARRTGIPKYILRVFMFVFMFVSCNDLASDRKFYVFHLNSWVTAHGENVTTTIRYSSCYHALVCWAVHSAGNEMLVTHYVRLIKNIMMSQILSWHPAQSTSLPCALYFLDSGWCLPPLKPCMCMGPLKFGGPLSATNSNYTK